MFFYKSVTVDNVSYDEIKDEIRKIVTEVLAVQKKEGVNPTDRILTRKEVCDELNVSNQTLHTWNKIGVLPAFNIGTRVYYRWQDVLDAMKRVA